MHPIARFLPLFALLATACQATGIAAQPPAELITTAERTEFAKTGTYEDVTAFMRALDASADTVHLTTLGQTVNGRDIPLAIIADPPVTAAEEARSDDRTIVLLFGAIHAGEIAGKEALQMLARDLVSGEADGARTILDDLIILIAPIYNADGNDRMAPDNRPGQDGPDEMGERHNTDGYDLNRDWIKLDAPETRAMVKLFNEWDPSVVVDTHTTNGTNHRFTLTYQGPKHPAGDPELIEFVRTDMLPVIDEAVEAATDYELFFYGNISRDKTQWYTYPAGPRYGTPYRGLRNRLGILVEAYAHASFEDRVQSSYAFCLELLKYSAEHTEKIADVIRDAERTVTGWGRSPAESPELALQTETRAFADKVTIPAFEETREGDEVIVGEPRDYQVDLLNDYVPSLTVPRPYAYVLPESLSGIARHLQLHGIEVDVIRERLDVPGEITRIESVETGRPQENHEPLLVTGTSRSSRPVAIDPGAFIVRTAQPLGALASYMLEPEAEDGLVKWNFFDDHVAAGQDFPVIRLTERTPVLSTPAPEIGVRHQQKLLTYDVVYGNDRKDRPNLSGGSVGVIRWLDDEHFLQRKEGTTWRVEARTGKAEEFGTDTSEIAKVIAQLPSISRKQADRFAERYFNAPRPEDDPGVVFLHADDLYWVSPDGTAAKRLTATPEIEELAELSPDGVWAAFVRENDLFVVDIATGTERALTTGGADDLRRGKNDWVYFEELYGRSWKGYWWSPTSDAIAFFMTDATEMPSFTVVDDAREPQAIETVRYPKPGQRNPHVEVAIVSPAGGRPSMVDLSGYGEGQYLVSSVRWNEDGRTLRLAVQNREQTWLDWFEVGSRGGEGEVLRREETPAWIEPYPDPTPVEGGQVWRHELDGWMRLYFEDDDGNLTRLTPRGGEVRSVQKIDEDAGVIYYTSVEDACIAPSFYRVPITGGDPEQLTLEDGSHSVILNPAGTMFVDTWSSTDEPTKSVLRSTEDGRVIRWLDTNPVHALDEWALGELELVRIPSKRGNTFEGYVIYPPGFDPTKTYPVWFKTYGGPHAPTVRDSWRGGRIDEQMYAALGIVIVRADPFPASGKGVQSTWTTFRRLGVRERDDVAEIIGWVREQPWADADRIGMDGWSFGGYLTSYCMATTDLFHAGIAGAPVTDWREYDTIYTERYMGTPQSNPDGYDETSVVEHADGVHGRMLIVHGTIDDNVHMQNSVKLIDALQDADKDFEFMIYPGQRHGVRTPHRQRLYYDFITRMMLGDS